MADNIIPFDKYHRRKKATDLRQAEISVAHLEVKLFLKLLESNALTCGELTHLATLLSPLSLLAIQKILQSSS